LNKNIRLIFFKNPEVIYLDWPSIGIDERGRELHGRFVQQAVQAEGGEAKEPVAHEAVEGQHLQLHIL